MSQNLLTPYCTTSDLKDALSSGGVDQRLSDVPPDTYGNIIHDASARINFFCQRTYDPAKLAQSDWVNFVAKYVGAYYLCARRGNPPPGILKEIYTDCIADLKSVHKGRPIIPDITARQSFMVRMSNNTIVLNPVMHSRVERGRSIGPAGYTQRANWGDAGQYGTLDMPLG